MVRAWPKPLREESAFHQACADNDHDKAEGIINKLLSGEGGGPIELKRQLLHLNANKQAWTRDSPQCRQTSNPDPNPNAVTLTL